MEQYDITGMSCAACSARVEKAVSHVDGVQSCAVNLLTNSMNVEGTASPEAIIKAVEDAGYGASKKGAGAAQPKQEASEDHATAQIRTRLLWSVIFLTVLMYASMGHAMWNWPMPPFFEGNPIGIALLQMLLTIIVMVLNQAFFKNGFKSLWHRSPNMDTLVALGSAAAFGYSTCVLFLMTRYQADGMAEHAAHMLHELYFESAAMILTLITVGKMLESRAKGKTTDALKSLMKLAPETVVVERDGKEVTVPIDTVKKGDIFIVKPGESIPVDGIVLFGDSAVNEAALTGESVPADKKVGDTVSAATINLSGFLRCEATHVGEDTTLAKIIQLVNDASGTKAPIAKIADRVSGVFVPVVIAIAVVTTIIWLLTGATVGYALARGISVLVISCPCALGLATPVAIMVGSGKGARNGILFKTAACLEETGKAEIVALDKTGTITKGEPSVTDLLPADGVTEEKLLSLAGSLEKRSEHPLAKAVVALAGERSVTLQDTEQFEIVPGNGLKATMGGTMYYGGSLNYIKSITSSALLWQERAEALAKQGKTPLLFATDKGVIGMIAVADTIKEESAKAIGELYAMGLDVVMLTGDNEMTAQAIAGQAGIKHVIAGVLPDGKEAAVRGLMQKGKTIMVGDGINDAPALTRADIGMAIGAGTDIAIDAADVVLMRSSLADVPAAIRLSRQTRTNIKENLFWAFIYNVIGIPLAAGVYIHWLHWELNPMFGAAAMSLSSFCVVSNALRLNLFDVHDSRRDKKRKKKERKETTMTKTMKIEGMMCGHCEARVKKCLEALPEVSEAVVSHTDGSAVLTLTAEVPNEVLKKTVEDQGYDVTSIA